MIGATTGAGEGQCANVPLPFKCGGSEGTRKFRRYITLTQLQHTSYTFTQINYFVRKFAIKLTVQRNIILSCES